MAASELKLFADRMSQPSRSCLIFCKAAGVPFEEVVVNLGKRQQQAPPFLAINPLGKVPALQDGSFCLAESGAILRYLCATQPVAPHWYPADPRARAQVDAALSWHAGTLRQGSMLTVWNRAISRSLGFQGDEHLVTAYALPTLKTALQALEGVWLAQGPFLAGQQQPTIADLLVACELEQLCLLEGAAQGPTMEELLAPHPRTCAWLDRVRQATAPHYDEVHGVVRRVRDRLAARKQSKLAATAAASRPLHAVDLPADCWAAIAGKLVDEWEQAAEESDEEDACDEFPRQHQPDKVHLAATCRALQAASVDWFRGDTYDVDGSEPPPAEHLVWLARVQAQVELALDGSRGATAAFEALIAGGARIVCLSCGGPHPPPELAGLTALSSLHLGGSAIDVQGGWQHLPRQLQHLSMWRRGPLLVPAELAALTQLSTLSLTAGCIQGGWQHLPRQLQQLSLCGCGLQKVPKQLSSLAQLSQLSFSNLLSSSMSNPIKSGWQHLPPSLQQLDPQGCILKQVPALGALAQLSKLSLASNRIKGGWQHLPPSLQQLDLSWCELQQLPAQLAGLTLLRELRLTCCSIWRGWQHLPQQLQELNLWTCGLQQVPPEMAGLTQLSKLILNNNRITGGWQRLPQQLQRLDLRSCDLERVLSALSRLTQLTRLGFGNNDINHGWQHLPPSLRRLDLDYFQREDVPAELVARQGLTITGEW